MYFCEYFTFEPLLAFLIIYAISFLHVTSYGLVSRLFVYFLLLLTAGYIHTMSFTELETYGLSTNDGISLIAPTSLIH